MNELFITVHEASLSTGFPVKKWFQWILQGLIPSMPELKADNIKGISYSCLSQQVLIPVSALPKYYRTKLVKSRLLGEQLFDIDFIGFLDQYGEAKYRKLLAEIILIRDFIHCRQNGYDAKTEKSREFAKQSGYSLATLYRKESVFMKSDLKKLVSVSPKIYHPQSMCRLSEDYAKFEWSKPNHLAKIEIQSKLEEEARALGREVCDRCPYNANTSSHKRFLSRYPELNFCCSKMGGGMLYPASKDPFNRYLSSIGEQELKYSREGANAWRDEFMHVTKRDKPELVNAAWFGDHFLGDVLLIFGYDKNKRPILKRPWHTCNLDAASSALVGSVVCAIPNSMTIAECFCRSAAFTVDSPFHNLPEIYYVDRGKDFRSTMLEGRNYDMRQRLDQHYYLNRAFCDNPLLPALNVTIRHALPKSGRSKNIERQFGTIIRKYLQEIPGWVGNCPQNRPFDFAEEEKRLIESGELWTFEKYARYWFDVVVPAYNNTIQDGETESPLQKYLRLEKANTIVPDWNTLSVFKAKKPLHKVHPQGIKYNKELYWHPALSEEGIMGNYVSIYDFDQTFCHSISVIHNGKYICEAEPLVHQQVLEPDRLKLAQHLEEQKAQKRRISRRVTVVRQTLKKAGVKAQRYIDYEPADDLADANTEEVKDKYIMYCETIDESRDTKEAVILSETANEIARVAEQTKANINRIINGPISNAFENYYAAKGKSITDKEN